MRTVTTRKDFKEWQNADKATRGSISLTLQLCECPSCSGFAMCAEDDTEATCRECGTRFKVNQE